MGAKKKVIDRSPVNDKIINNDLFKDSDISSDGF